MQFDDQKIEDAVLGLLGAFAERDGHVWKRYEFTVMDSLYKKGYISDPHGRRESVYLSEEGLQRAKELACKMFAR